MKLNFSIFIYFILFFNSYAQINIHWQKCLGGSDTDWAFSVKQTNDGGYIVAGYTESNDGDVTLFYGAWDVWIVKLNITGNIEWQKSFGGSGSEYANDIIQTNDGGFIFVGQTFSNNVNVSGNHGNGDYWVVKIDASGNLQWQKCLGGSGDDEAFSIKQTTDGGYIIAGNSSSNDGDVTGNHGNVDYWIVKINSIGNIQWQKSLGGSSYDRATSIIQTIDGGYIVAGYTGSIDGDVTLSYGNNDFWIVKLNSSGNLDWQKSFGGSGYEEPQSIQQTNDGGYIIVGYSESNDGDVSMNQGEEDFWIVKINNIGTIEWEKSYGGSWQDWGFSVRQTPDFGYIVAGATSSMGGDVLGNHGIWDFWIIKLNSNGILEWQKCFGGTDQEGAYAMSLTSDGGVVMAGVTNSIDGDVTGNHGGGDYWVVKLTSVTSVSENNLNIDLTIYPNPSTNELNISFTLESQKEIKIELYNSLGQIVKLISKGRLPTGKNEINFSVADLPIGVYHLKFSAGDKMVVKRVVKM